MHKRNATSMRYSYLSVSRCLSGCIVGIALILVSTLLVAPTFAQSVPDDLLKALQARGAGADGTDVNGAGTQKPVVQTYQPVGEQAPQPRSVIEDLYSRRAGRTLDQVGYHAFGAPGPVSVSQNGALQDTYVVGVGDALVIDLRGQENSSYHVRVDGSGRVVLPKLNPLAAAGRTLGDFRKALSVEIERAYVSTNAFVTLGEVHQVSVLVGGYVRTPGMRILSALSSPVDALLLSGGILKTGSLRKIQLVRNGIVRTLDLYPLIVSGGTVRLGMLQDGDRIFVPSLGPTVAIAGNVSRPGIYELAAGRSSIVARDLVAIAGGASIPNAYDVSKVTLGRDGSTRLISISLGDSIGLGEVVLLDPKQTANFDRVTIAGAVQEPTTRPLSSRRTANELFRGVGDLLPTAYTPFAIVIRRDQATNAQIVFSLSLVRALTHTSTVSLQSDDRIYVFSVSDLRAIARFVTKDMNSPYNPRPNVPASNAVVSASTGGVRAQVPPTQRSDAASPNSAVNGAPSVDSTPQLTAPSQLQLASGVSTDPRLRNQSDASAVANGSIADAEALLRTKTGGGLESGDANLAQTDDNIVSRVAAESGLSREMLLSSVSNHIVWVLDQVNVPGAFAAADGTTISDMIAAAGGTQTQADLSSIEVTSTEVDQVSGVSRTVRKDFSVSSSQYQVALVLPRDVIRLRQVFGDRTGESIVVSGEVRFPGVFDITRDERLSSVLERAGGITEVGYPYGAIFTRRSAAVHEQENNARMAKELQSELAVLAATPTQSGTSVQGGVEFLSTLVAEMRDAPTIGRVAVLADPTALATHPELDPLLEPGDVIYIPKRPNTVTVSGEVLNPGSFQVRSGLGVDDYIALAGGVTQAARRSDSFIILPDGTAKPIGDNWISFSSGLFIPPGSTVVVPRDLRPFDWGQFLKDATQVISQLAVSAASLAVLRNN